MKMKNKAVITLISVLSLSAVLFSSCGDLTHVTNEKWDDTVSITEKSTDTAETNTLTETASDTETAAESVTETQTEKITETTAEITEPTPPETEPVPVTEPVTAPVTQPVTEPVTTKAPPAEYIGPAVPAGTVVVYLTFDDGPNAKNTNAILDILAQKGVHATFFTVGNYVRAYPDLIRRMYNEGHVVGCHSMSHNLGQLYSSRAAFDAELDSWESAVTNALGFVPEQKVFRFPGGSSKNNKYLREALNARGYKGFDWNCLNNDCNLRSKPGYLSDEEYLKQSFLDTLGYSFKLSSPHIILMHETYTQTAEMLGWAIDWLREAGCVFGTPDQLSASWYYN